MAPNRAAGRNVHIFDAKDTDQPIGGFIMVRGGRVTNANLYHMIERLCTFTSCTPFKLTFENEESTLERNDSLLSLGNYYIHSDRI